MRNFFPLQRIVECVMGTSLTPTEKLVAICIAAHMNRETGEAFPSDERVARETGFSARTIRNAIPVLIERGIFIASRGGSRVGEKRAVSRYRLGTAESVSSVGRSTKESRSGVAAFRSGKDVPTTAEIGSNDHGNGFRLTNEVNQGIEPEAYPGTNFRSNEPVVPDLAAMAERVSGRNRLPEFGRRLGA
jgi:hypothetical protein